MVAADKRELDLISALTLNELGQHEQALVCHTRSMLMTMPWPPGHTPAYLRLCIVTDTR